MKRLFVLLLVACGGPQSVAEAPDDDIAVDEQGHEGDDHELPAVTPSDRALHDEAMRIVRAANKTSYSHRTMVDEDAGRFEVDCSGLVDYALANTKPHALAELRGEARRRPLAKDFVEFLRALPPQGRGAWRRTTADKLAPGDIIAWLKPADVTTKNTGHVMIVRELPRRDPQNGSVLIVPIIDAAAMPHGKGDSRKMSKTTGVGTGEILLALDELGAPIGYRWSRGTNAKLHETTIAFGSLR